MQQDGARPHTKEGLIRQLGTQVGAGEDDDFFCKLYTQPPNSPDVNINDLAFFHSIKTRAMKQKSRCLTIAEKMIHVQEAFKAYPKDKITDIWACYFSNLRGVMKETGAIWWPCVGSIGELLGTPPSREGSKGVDSQGAVKMSSEAWEPFISKL